MRINDAWLAGGLVSTQTAIGIAVAAGLLLSWLRMTRLSADAILRAYTITAIAAVVGGRLVFVALNTDYFQANPAQMFALRDTPGLSEHGALAAILLASLRMPRAWRAALACGVLCCGIAASLACIEQGCAAGREVFPGGGLGWALRADWPDALLIRNPRWPAQFFLAGGLSAALLALLLRRPRKALYWAALAAAGVDFGVHFARAEPVIWGSPLALAQWLDIAILCASSWLLMARKRAPSAPSVT
jgi:prolipoprotein diacylglyceryltransferase